MEVACNQCGAKYQFDAATIPAGGYDAQCTSCGGVFFVAPEIAGPPPVCVTCAHCGTVYQFPASAIPAEGYDAQCTQCNNVFFVAAQSGALGTAASTEPVPAPAPIPEPAAMVDESPVVLAAKKEPQAEEPLAIAPDNGADLMQMADDLGEPDDDANGFAEGDFERILARRKKRRRIIGLVLGVIVGYTLISYFAVPRLFDLTLGRLVGIKLTVNPEAIPYLEKGRSVMLADTEQAYLEALKALEQGLLVDPAFPEVIALTAICHIFRGVDMQILGKEVLDSGARVSAEIKALEELPVKSRPPDFAKRVEELRAQASRAAAESVRLFEAGGHEVNTAQSLLRPAINKFKTSAIVSAAAGIYYTTDVDSQARATEMLRMAVELQSGANSALDLKNPPDHWTPLLQGLVKVSSRGGDEDARAAFEAALKKEPKLVRAKLELVNLFDRQGKQEDARKLATEILAQVPTHSRARAFIARQAAPPAPVAIVKSDKAATDTALKAKKAKGKRKR